MKGEIRWTALIEASCQEEARMLLLGLGRACRRHVEVLGCERLDRTRYRVVATSLLGGGPSMASTVVEALRVTSWIAPHWIVTGPRLRRGGRWEFEGAADGRLGLPLPSVTWLAFWVDNEPARVVSPAWSRPRAAEPIHPLPLHS